MLKQLLVALSLTLLCASSVHGVELEYKWKKGQTHRFNFEADTQVEMKMGGAMGGMMGGAMGGQMGGQMGAAVGGMMG